LKINEKVLTIALFKTFLIKIQKLSCIRLFYFRFLQHIFKLFSSQISILNGNAIDFVKKTYLKKYVLTFVDFFNEFFSVVMGIC